MADNNRNRRNRDIEGNRRPRPQPQRAPASGDPLAELARLIGQQNEAAPPPFRHSGARDAAASEPGWPAPDPYAKPDGYRPDDGTSQWASSYFDRPAAEPDPAGHGGYEPRYAAPQYPDQQSYTEDPRHGDPRYSDPRHADPRYDDQRYGDPRYADPRYADPRDADPRHDPRLVDSRLGAPRFGATPHHDDAYGYADPRQAEPNFAVPPPQFGAPRRAPAPHDFAQPGHYAQPGHADQGYPAYADPNDGRSFADPYYATQPEPMRAPVAERRMAARKPGNLVTVLAVLALAVVGTAAAYGYRAMFGGAGTPVPPPVIKADTRPSKIVPATDPNAKPIQDRVGVKTERVVPREEQPVQQAAPGQPRVISPWLGGQNPQAFPPASANAAPPSGTAAPQGAASPAAPAPKRIRTVPIKPEQGTEAPSQRSPRASAAPASQPVAEPASASAPLALSPTTGSVPQRSAARQAHAALPPSSNNGSPFPTPLPPGTGSAPVNGAYAVQVTSQRSESDAQASYRSLQQQFPAVLGNRQPVIRRADLGEKGTYYRAQIPFQSQGEASDFCSSLKAAGGQCVVQRN